MASFKCHGERNEIKEESLQSMAKFFDRVAICYDIIPYLLRINYPIVEKEMSLKKGQKVLDVGGGTGRLAEKIVNLFDAEVTILDPSRSMLKRVKLHPRIKTIYGEIEKAPFNEESFDVIVCVDTLHHLRSPKNALQQMHRILKPKGKIFIQDFDITKFRTKILRFGEECLGERGRFYSPQVLEKMLKEIGFDGFVKPILKIQYLYIGKKI